MKRWLAISLVILTGCSSAPKPPPKTVAQLQAERMQRIRDRQAAYVARHPETAEEVKRAILSGGLVAGMSVPEVLASIGAPAEIIRTTTPEGESDRWVYGPRFFLYFRGGRLGSWEN